MDNLTHTLTGMVLARSGLSQRFGRGTTLLLALASNVPDVDAVLTFGGRRFAPSRRTLTHSVVGVPILALLLAWAMGRACPDMPFRTRFGLSLIGAGIHVFMDVLNSYGVELLYPMSSARYELAWTFIIDLAMWAILLAPFVLGMTPARALGMARLYRASAVALAAYIALCGVSHARARTLLARTVREEGLEPDFTYVFPEALGPHRWRGVTREGSEYRTWLIHAWGGVVEPVATAHTDKDLPEVRAVRERPEAQRIERFFKAPAWRLLPDSGMAEVTDLRFGSAVLKGRGDAFKYAFPIDVRSSSPTGAP